VQSHRVTFEGSQGFPLAARLEMPTGAPSAFALFAHCFTCGKDSSAAVRISRALAARGIAVLRFDFTGLGGSGGDFGNANFSSNVNDLVAAAAYLRQNHQAPALLVGHSLGGAAVLSAAGRIPEVTAVATVAAPADATHVEHNFMEAVPEIERTGAVGVTLGGRHFTIRRQFLEDLRHQEVAGEIARLGRALLVMHAPLDAQVGIENAQRIFVAARHPKSFVSLDDADHLLTKTRDAEYAAAVIAEWAGRYLPQAEPRAHAAEDGRILVAETGGGRFQAQVTMGPHTLLADEPTDMGGLGSGPNPYDLLAAALGACKVMTARLYAERKGWPATKLSTNVAHNKIHAKDCAECETREGMVDAFDVTLTIEGDLDDEQRARIAEIADRCPVHRTLMGEVRIRTTLEPPAG
jgi:putative redox protein